MIFISVVHMIAKIWFKYIILACIALLYSFVSFWFTASISAGTPHQSTITNPVSFSWTVNNHTATTSYEVSIMDFYGQQLGTNQRTSVGNATTTTPSQLGLWSTMSPGVYKRQVRSLHEWVYQTSDIFTFMVHNAGTNQLAWFMELGSMFGNVLMYNNNLYTDTTQIQAHLYANIAGTVDISWQLNPALNNISLPTSFPYSMQAVNLQPGDGTKNLTAIFSANGISPVTVNKSIILDTTAPTTPTLISPLSNTSSSSPTFSWNASTDAGIGLSGYTIQISHMQNFSTILYSAQTTNTSYTLSTWLTQWQTYYRRVSASDRLWHQSTSSVGQFVAWGSTTQTDIQVSFSSITNANLNVLYTSNIVTIDGLSSAQVPIQISTGLLLINNNPSGTNGFVSNGSTVQIALMSASSYNASISSTVSIAGQTVGNFSITTRSPTTGDTGWANELTDTQKANIAVIFQALVNTYGPGHSSTLSLMLSLKDRVALMMTTASVVQSPNSLVLQYFLMLINQYLADYREDSWTRYITRNGRIFSISYDATRVAYTSQEFFKPAFFASWNAMKQHIDIHNPGAITPQVIGTIQPLPTTNRWSNIHVMPNGKIYKIQQKPNGKWHSPDMVHPREFDTAAAALQWISSRNQSLWIY